MPKRLRRVAMVRTFRCLNFAAQFLRVYLQALETPRLFNPGALQVSDFLIGVSKTVQLFTCPLGKSQSMVQNRTQCANISTGPFPPAVQVKQCAVASSWKKVRFLDPKKLASQLQRISGIRPSFRHLTRYSNTVERSGLGCQQTWCPAREQAAATCVLKLQDAAQSGPRLPPAWHSTARGVGSKGGKSSFSVS